ncbi:hypothetical protein BGZ46_007047 [Entomortierella lignicola]|nr:hypothetical protein BGZ46_007047 [Entomortierella lignicola]
MATLDISQLSLSEVVPKVPSVLDNSSIETVTAMEYIIQPIEKLGVVATSAQSLEHPIALDMNQLSVSEATPMVPSIPTYLALDNNSIVTATTMEHIINPTMESPQSNFPIKVTTLPNKGRCYVATRTIQPQELIFVAEAFGTTMCDPWLDCGVCHYCWMTIQDRKAQVRLPRVENEGKGKKSSSRKKQETVMVFCDETCLQLYGSEMAQTICQVEQKIRRTWNENETNHWKLKSSTTSPATSAPPTTATTTTIHYSELIQQALSMANTSQEVLKLSDQDLHRYLDNVWNALDGMINEQESFLLDQTTRTINSTIKFQQHIEALYPILATHLLQGNNNATIASRMSDDDCETARLISEVLYRRQSDIQDQNLASSSSILRDTKVSQSKIQGERATYADYCAMQSNELVLFRQQLNLDISERDLDEQIVQEKESNDHNHHSSQWRQLISILPTHLLNCFYVYLRLRDAYFLLAQEKEMSSFITLSINNSLFRTILYAEVANSFGIRDASDELLGFAVFPRACFFNHSCRPNVQKKRRQGDKSRQMEYWSTRVIEQGEECCISYGDISKGREERQNRLEDMYFFRCSCTRCVEEEEAEKNQAER